MAVTIDGAGPLAGATTLNGLTIPTTGFGKVLQVVKSDDSTDRTTTSSSFTDATGVTVSITPQFSDSIIYIDCTFFAAGYGASNNQVDYQLTTSANAALTGAQAAFMGDTGVTRQYGNLRAYHLPASTSTQTYKLRFRQSGGGTAAVNGATCTTVMRAIEVSA